MLSHTDGKINNNVISIGRKRNNHISRMVKNNVQRVEKKLRENQFIKISP